MAPLQFLKSLKDAFNDGAPVGAQNEFGEQNECGGFCLGLGFFIMSIDL